MRQTTSVLLLCQLLSVGCHSEDADKPVAVTPTAPPQKVAKTKWEAARSDETPDSKSLLNFDANSQLLMNRSDAAAAAEANPDAYAWLTFVYLNSPENGTDAKVWESWRQTSTVYLPDGSKPSPWGTPSTIPPDVLQQAATLPDWPASSVWHNLDTRIQVDGLVLLDKWGQDVRYQLLMNEPTFQYILGNGLYNVNGQQATAENKTNIDFPNTSYELKTSYIWIGSDTEKYDALKETYYVVRAYYQTFDNDGAPTGYAVGYAALSGMHVIDKAIPTWIWVTFENVNNSSFTRAELELPIPKEAQAANKIYQTALKGAGSVFANYQLDGVQTAFVDSANQPVLLANSNIESAFQKKSSCSTCHAVAAINETGKYFNLVDSSGGDVSYYVGIPPKVEDQGYTSLDFVWSMRRAHRQSANRDDREKQ